MIRKNIDTVLKNIEDAAIKSGRKKEDITLVAVTKTVDASRIKEAYDAGLKIYGENRVQEFLQKKDEFEKDVSWHIIGRLQTNKIKYIIDNDIVLLQSLDRMDLALEIQKQCEKKNKDLNVLLEINTAGEDTKAGFDKNNIFEYSEKISQLDRIKVKGLMTVAPFTDDEKYLRGIFKETKDVFDKIKKSNLKNFDLELLSMGMSGDYAWAIEEGANMVRVGSAIFGHRNY